jgi:hypothetical protein
MDRDFSLPSGSRSYWGFTEDGKLKPEKIAFSGLGFRSPRALQRPSLRVDALGHLAICGDPLPAVLESWGTLSETRVSRPIFRMLFDVSVPR